MFANIHLRKEDSHFVVEAEQFADGMRIAVSNEGGFYCSFSISEFEELITKGQQALQEADLKKTEKESA